MSVDFNASEVSYCQFTLFKWTKGVRCQITEPGVNSQYKDTETSANVIEKFEDSIYSQFKYT